MEHFIFKVGPDTLDLVPSRLWLSEVFSRFSDSTNERTETFRSLSTGLTPVEKLEAVPFVNKTSVCV